MLEYETEINSKSEMEQALLLMDYKQAVTINKTRLTTHYKNYEIDIDEVDGLGQFIEVEQLFEESNKEKVTKIQEEMFNFLISLGVDKDNRINKGYDILMLEKNIQN